MRSLESRLHIGLSFSLALLIAAAWWLGHDALHRSTDAYVLSRLTHDAEALLGQLRQRNGGDGGLAGLDIATTAIYRQPLSGHYYEILSDAGETLRSRSLWDQDLNARRLRPGTSAHWKTHLLNGEPLLVYSAGYRLEETNLTIAVAEDLTPLLAVLRGFERLFALLALVGFGLMLLVQRLIVKRTLRRLHPVYRDINNLERGTASRLTEDVPSEIQPLVKKLNGLLSIYEKRLQRSRNAAGNLAHAIKAPLNLLLQQLEHKRQPIDADGRRLCREQIQRVRALAERELKRARIAGGAHAGSSFDPATELPVLKDVLLRMYSAKALTIDCRIDPPGPLAADREDMLELFGTLLDNACKWAVKRVDCRLRWCPGGIVLSVEDDGAGCSAEEIEAIGIRGVRLDERVSGHGLGLSIALEIADLYGGDLRFGRSERLGGFSARLALPLRESSTAALRAG
jgi:signal transduction histidine kinase